MEQVLNFPYEDNVNLVTIEQIVRKKFPSYKIKAKKRNVMMSKNFLAVVRFSIKEVGDNRQLFFKTKMNIWILAFVLLMYAFCGCYSWSEWGHFNDDDILAITITSILPFVVWLVYLIMKIGLISKVKRALEQELPNYLINRREYFFPPNFAFKKWKQAMQPVSLLILFWGIVRVVMGIIVGVPIVAYYVGTHYSDIQQYGNLLSNLLLLSVSIVFVMKSYNHYWQIAKYLFLSYTIWMTLLSLLSIIGILINFESTTLFLTVNAVESCISWVLMAVFAYYFYRSLSNTSSLYLLKATAIWIIFSVILLVDFSYFNLTYQPVFSYDSPEYHTYKLAQQGYQLRSYIWSVAAGWTYIIGLVKSLFTLKDYVPQGIGIKIN